MSARDWAKAFSPDVAGRLLESMADIVLVCNSEGVITDTVQGNPILAREINADWGGRRWLDVVTVESRPKVAELIRSARGAVPSEPREINHPTSSGVDVPIRYSTVGIDGSGRFIAIGHELRHLADLQRRLVRMQEAMEQEYSRMRVAETRYRMLFHLASDPVLIIDATTLRIIEANPAAVRDLSGAGESERLENRLILSFFSYDGAEALEAALKTARRAGRVPELDVRLAQNGKLFHVAASAFRQERVTYLLVRLTPDAVIRRTSEAEAAQSRVVSVIEQLPDGFVVIDGRHQIVEVNQAFLDMAQLGSKAQALGEPLQRWLGRPGVDLDLLMARLDDNRAVRSFVTVMRGSYGSEQQVEVSAVPSMAGAVTTYGFIIRNSDLRQALNGQREQPLHRSVEQLTELVGRMSLKDMVRESSDMIERLCIEAALEKSGKNRAYAAQLLGLSRQSLYTKMRRHGLGNLDGDPGEEF